MAVKKTASAKARPEKTGKVAAGGGKSAASQRAKGSKQKVQAAKRPASVSKQLVRKQPAMKAAVKAAPSKAPQKVAVVKKAAPVAKPVIKPVLKVVAPAKIGTRPAAPVAAAAPLASARPAAAAAPKMMAPKAIGAKPMPVGMVAKPFAPVATQIRAVAAAMAKSPAQRISAPVTPKDIAAKAVEARQNLAAAKKPVSQRHGFKTNEFVVYPAHGVGRIVGIEEQEIAGMSLELFVITFDKDKMTLRVPTGKLQSVGMRKLAEEPIVRKAMETLKGRARVKRTMWSRRAQEYEAKINSGDLVQIAEVVRDLYRSEQQPEQSYSERQLYEAALDRMAREIAAVDRLDERGAMQRITEVLSKSARGRRIAEGTEQAGDSADVKAA